MSFPARNLMLRIGAFLLAALILLIMPAYASASENLLYNGDFMMLDDGDIPDGWYQDAYRKTPGYTTYSLLEKGASDGTNAVEIRNLGLNDARLAQIVEVAPETMYCLSADIRASGIEEGHGANLSIEGLYVFSKELYDTDGEWQHVEWYGETGEDQTELTVFARLGGYSGESKGRAAFSHLCLKEVEELPDDVIAARWFSLPASSDPDDETEEEKGKPDRNLLLAIAGLYTAVAVIALYLLSRSRRSASRTYSLKRWVFVLVFLSLCLRLWLSWITDGYEVDVNCFRSWGFTVLDSGPWGFYRSSSFCDYPPGYLGILGLNAAACRLTGAGAGLSRILFRLVPCLCDILLCMIPYLRQKDESDLPAAAAAVLFAWNPAMILNSACWGQMDSVLCLLIVLTAIAAMDGKWHLALPCYVLSVLVKPQALLLGILGLAVVIWAWIRQPSVWKRMLAGIGFSAAVACLVCLPYSFGQEDPFWLIQLYRDTLGSYSFATINTANLYYLAGGNWSGLILPAGPAAPLVMAACAALFWTVFFLRTRHHSVPGLRYPALGILGLFPPAFLLEFFLRLSWNAVGITGICFAFAAVLSIFAVKKDIRFLPYLGAVLFILLYSFGTKMHERYLFPALGLLLTAWFVFRDRRMLYLLVILSFTVFLNEGIILQNSMLRGAEYGHLNEDTTAIADFLAVVNLLSSGYALLLGLSAGEQEDCETLPLLPVRKLEQAPADAVPRKPSKRRLPEIVFLLVITAAYSVVTLTTLGSRKAPQTGWTSSEYEENVVFDLGENPPEYLILYFAKVSYYDFTFSQSDDGIHWSEESWAEMNQQQCWKWKYVTLSTEKSDGGRSFYSGVDNALLFSARYLRLTSHQIGLSLNEILFRDREGNPVKAVLCRHEGGNPESVLFSDPAALLDEQDTLEGLPSAFPLPEGEVPGGYDQPGWWNSTYFDEIYHARTGYEFVNQLVPYETTHPPLGKILISWGIQAFGMTPFGWRIAGALAGILMIPGIYLLVRRLTGQGITAVLAALLMALDCQHLTQTQIATIDSFPVLFIIFAFYFMLRFFQRDIVHERLVSVLADLAASGLCMGLAIASKWIGIYAGAGLACVYFWRCVRAVRNAPDRNDAWIRVITLCAFCILFFVFLPILLYLVCYIPYLAYNHQIRNLSDFVTAVWKAQIGMFDYHNTPGLGMDHYFYSPWWQWPIIGKPMYYASEGYSAGSLHHSIFCFGNPVVWYTGGLMMLYQAGKWISRKRYLIPDSSWCWHWTSSSSDTSAAFLLIGFLAQYLPWVLVPRGTYIYHYFASVPFLIAATCVFFREILDRNKKAARIGMLVLSLLALIGFIIFFPYASGIMAPEGWLKAGRSILSIWY